FVFDNLHAGQVDTITDFQGAGAGPGDSIALSLGTFGDIGAVGSFDPTSFVSGAGAVAADANDHIVYDTTTGFLYYDVDGNGSDAAIHFATVTGAPALTADDFSVVS